jgi:hypothetical protein
MSMKVMAKASPRRAPSMCATPVIGRTRFEVDGEDVGGDGAQGQVGIGRVAGVEGDEVARIGARHRRDGPMVAVEAIRVLDAARALLAELDPARPAHVGHVGISRLANGDEPDGERASVTPHRGPPLCVVPVAG